VAPPPPPPNADGRLPALASPRRYAVSLRVDPAQARFSGTTTIDLDVARPTWHLVLNARDMNVTRVDLRAGGAEIPGVASARTASGGTVPEELVLTFPRPIPAGAATLEIAYDAPFAADLAGIYRVQEDGRFYVFSQLESTDARRAFPCFDEPGFKTEYDVTIASPRGTMALANSPEASAEETADGMVVHRFQTSRPIPSYLFAVAVGDFDVVVGQSDPFPIRAVTTKGRAGLTSLALEATVGLVAKLGEYFDLRYPYAKLDLVAVPDFEAGAMENPGLITFRDSRLLLDAKHATASARREQVATIAHELAHMWFGDFVTMRWWDDVWLNEGFATWAESKIVDAWRPSAGATLEDIGTVQHVMDTDGLQSARAVREPVRSTSDAAEAFDDITYEKGAAVLRMVEGWLGADTFRRGVQRYLQDNAWKNASADDLFKALEFVSTQPVGRLAASLLDKPGVPEVSLTASCDAKRGSKLELRESEWHPLRDGGDAAGAARDTPRTWTLPVCVESDAQRSKGCFTLGAEPIVRDLGPGCPTWVYPNAGQAGYYRFLLDRKQLSALASGQRSLDAADRLGLVSNAWANVRQGAIDPEALLEFLPTTDGETNRSVVDQVVAVLGEVDAMLVEDGARAAWGKYVAARLSGKKRALGWTPRPGEADDRALERRVVLGAMGEIAADKATLDEAERFAAAWLKDPASVPTETAAAAVPVASQRAGAARLDELRAAARTAPTPEERRIAIGAMGAFDDPAIVRSALDLVLSGEVKLSEARYLLGAAVAHRAARPALYAWEKDNWTALRARMPLPDHHRLVAIAAVMCTPGERDEARAFFAGATEGMADVKRSLDESLERADLCVALRARAAAGVTRYLGRR
jgi:alanyl aminopeptidase